MQVGQKKDEIYGHQTLYRELGYFMTRQEQHERALKFFDTALAKYPQDRRALMGRSIARAKSVQYEGALVDINKALQDNPDNLLLLALKAMNTYLGCDFEKALVQNLRYLPKRKKPDNFSMGIMHCNQAIENGIGERAGRPLRDHYKIIRKLAWRKVRDAEDPLNFVAKRAKKKKKYNDDSFEPITSKKMKKKSKRISPHDKRYPCGEEPAGYELNIRESLYSHKAEDEDIPKGEPFPYRPLQSYTTNIENYMAEKYLKNMRLDKIFLKTLNNNKGVKCPNVDGSKKIVSLSKEGYKSLFYKQELLRTRRPFYFIKILEATSLSQKLKEKIEKEEARIRSNTEKKADDLLEGIKLSIQRRKTRVALELAEDLKVFCDSQHLKFLPRREEYLEEAYTLMGRAYLELRRLNPNQYEWDQQKRILAMLGVKNSREPSADSVLKQFKSAFVDWKKQITIAENRIQKATSQLEIAWLYHDLSRYYLEINKFDLARVYARKCIVEAKQCNNLEWVINAKLLITRINIQQHNRTDAKMEVNAAIELAKQMENDTLREYLEKTLQVVENFDFGDVIGNEIVEKREKQIITMMGGYGMKEEASHLFRQMAVMPASRRMSVMPGVKFKDTKKISSRKQSIMPATREFDDEGADTSKKEKGKDEETAKGVGFMELIQYHV